MEYHKKLFCGENKENKEIFQSLSEDSFKTCSSIQFKQAWIQRLPKESILWTFYGEKWLRKSKFISYRAKQSMQRQIGLRILGYKEENKKTDKKKNPSNIHQQLRSGLPIVVYYGAAKFPTNVKGNNATPVCSIAKRLSHFPNVTLVLADEFNTSQRCYLCRSKMKRKRLFSWKKKGPKTWMLKIRQKRCRMVRGWNYERVHRRCFKVLTCAQQGCINTIGIHRDVNACYNIYNNTKNLMQGKLKHKVFRRSKNLYAQA